MTGPARSDDESEIVAPAVDDLTVAERRVAVVRLRNAGVPWGKIAERFEISEATAMHDVAVALRTIAAENVRDLTANQIAVTRDMLRALYPNALRGDVGSVREVMRVLDHQAKLCGLYAPTKLAVAAVSEEDFAETTKRLLIDLARYEPEVAAALPPAPERRSAARKRTPKRARTA